MNTPVSALLGEKASRVYSVASNSTVLDAVRNMKSLHIGAVVVLDNEVIAGMFTERDVLQRVVADGKSPETTLVAEVMSQEVLTISPKTTVEEAMQMMTKHRHRHLPIVEGGELKGLISIGDVTRWVAEANENEAYSLRAYFTGGI